MLPLNIDELISELNAGNVFNYRFFYGHKNSADLDGCCSQWYPCNFTIDGHTYSSAEQWMMACKAREFGDDKTLKAILATDEPGLVKSLGRAVRGYDDKRWEEVRFDYVVDGNVNKFSQNESLKKYLLSTCNYVLVEASPYDKIWGIGMAKGNLRINDPRNWKGLNLLGFAIMKAREVIRNAQQDGILLVRRNTH